MILSTFGGSDMSEETQLSRRDLLLGMIRAEFPAYHPLLSIARIAHADGADMKLQFECHKTIAKYVEPELKSLEVKGELGHRHRVSVSLFGDPQVVPVEGAILEGSLSQPVLGHQPGEDVGIEQVFDTDPVVVDRTVREW